MSAAPFIGIDWGTTNARALLFAGDGTLLEDREAPLGVSRLAAGEHRAAFERLAGAWRGQHGPIPVLLSGMIGSRQGWREAPYLSCPATLSELHRALVPAPEVENAFIVPGLSLASPERRDVMRGEELQLLGLGAAMTGFSAVCIPGTHSKWIRAEWPVVREFRTAMTGELFAAILDHTLFAKILPTEKAAAFNESAFVTGLQRSAAPHGLPSELFGLRADLLLSTLAASDLTDAISGLLLGTEIRAARPLLGPTPRVALLAAPALQERYLRALRFFAIEAVAFDVKQIAAQGFAALMRARS